MRRQQARWLMFSFTIFGLYLALTAIAEYRGWTAIVMPRYVISGEFEEFLGRARGPFLNPSANGIYMTTALACLLMYWPRTSGLTRIGLELGALIIGIGCFATLTRCVWLGFFLGLITLTWLCSPKRVRLGLLILFLCVSTLGVSLNWHRLVAFKRDKGVPASQMAESARLRPMLAAVAWQMFQRRPITGYGLGQYTHSDDEFIAARRVDMPLDRVRPYHQHNFVLSLATETGLLGTLPFLALVMCWSLAAYQLWRCETAPLEVRQLGLVYLVSFVNFVANGMFQDVTIIPTVNLLLFFLGGTTMAAVSTTDLSERWVWRRLLSGSARGDRRDYRSPQPVPTGK
jgi:O-antigen ligase